MFSQTQALTKFSHFRTLKIKEALLSIETAALAFKIMKKCTSVSFYDASYHALALYSGGTFITADKKYFKKARSFGHIQQLKTYLS